MIVLYNRIKVTAKTIGTRIQQDCKGQEKATEYTLKTLRHNKKLEETRRD